MTLEGSFEPTVMFFGLTNSLATFQTIINKILQDLINTGEVASFIDNIIVETEEEEDHHKVVEEVVKRIAKNDLYIKLEKCKQKVRKVKFLEVAIRPERIKIEEEKVKGVLDWLTSKGIKDIQKFLDWQITVSGLLKILHLQPDYCTIFVELDREAEGVQEVEGEIYKRTSASSTRLKQKK